MANGFVLAALTGRGKIMSCLAPEGPSFYSGTFNGHLLSVVASQKTIEIMRTEPVHEKLFRLGKMMADGINDAIRQTGINAVCYNYGSIWCVYFTVDKVETYRDIMHFAATKDSRIDRAYHIHLSTTASTCSLTTPIAPLSPMRTARTTSRRPSTYPPLSSRSTRPSYASRGEPGLREAASASVERKMKRVGVDIGGTFTDLVVFDEVTGAWRGPRR